MATIETTGNLSSLFASAKSDILVASLYCNSFAYYTVSQNILSFPAATQLVLTALAVVLKDEGCKLPSPQATEAMLLNNWCEREENQRVLSVFAEKLVAELSTPFKGIRFKKDQSAARFVTHFVDN